MSKNRQFSILPQNIFGCVILKSESFVHHNLILVLFSVSHLFVCVSVLNECVVQEAIDLRSPLCRM